MTSQSQSIERAATMCSKKRSSFVHSCRQFTESNIYLIKYFLLNVLTTLKFMLNIHFDYDNNYYSYISRKHFMDDISAATSAHDRLPDREQEQLVHQSLLEKDVTTIKHKQTPILDLDDD
uniref:Uncharacterized protein n=1 Tax=Glossina austeni TaxID=7395 RepID=A0A1A9VCJ4_GLOAU